MPILNVSSQTGMFPGTPVYTDGVHLTANHADWMGEQGPDISRFQAVHDLAGGIGLRKAWFQAKAGSYPHYDLISPRRAVQAVRAGALLLASWKDYARLCAAPGSCLRPDGWMPEVIPSPSDELIVERHLSLMRIFCPTGVISGARWKPVRSPGARR